MAKKQPRLQMKNWADGMSDSPHVAGMMALLKNVEIDSFTGAARGGKKPETAFHTAYSSTFTAVAATDVCTSTATVPPTSTCVQLTTTGTLPAGLSLATNYFIIKLSATTFKLATTVALAEAGTGVDITDTGTGTHTVTTVNPGTIRHIVRDPNTGTKFLIDSNGVVWYGATSTLYLVLSTNTAKTNAAGNGLAIFRVSDGSATYLFAFRNALIDVINVYATANLQTPSWTYGWQTMNTAAGMANSHHAIVGQDNIVYYADDRYIGSITEVAGQVFDPATGSTYTFSSQALDLPLGSVAFWLEQLGVNLLITVSNDSYIYPWDRSSDSYGLPIPIGEWGGNKMKNIGNVVYVLAGTKGNIYWTQGTYARLFKPIGQYLTNNTATGVGAVTWGGIGIASGKLVVGVGASSGQSGVYMLTPEGKMTIDNYPSTGQANVTAILAQDDYYDMGYAGGADTIESTRYQTYEAVIQSELFRVGDKTTKTKLSTVEVQLAVGIVGTIRIGYRTNTTGAFTTIATFVTSTSASSHEQDVGTYLTDLENVQFQVEYDHGLDLLEVNFYE